MASVKKLLRRVGRRGAFLWFLAILDWAYGYAILTAKIAALKLGPNLLLPYHTWGWLWIAFGFVCLTGSFMRRDRFAFTLSAMFKTAWAAVWADVWLVQHYYNAWLSVVIWLAFAATVVLVAGWPDISKEISDHLDES